MTVASTFEKGDLGFFLAVAQGRMRSEFPRPFARCARAQIRQKILCFLFVKQRIFFLTRSETPTKKEGNDLRFLPLQTAHAIIDEAVHV